MPIILFVDGQKKARANVLAQHLQSCLSFSTRKKKLITSFLSQYNTNYALKYDLSEKGFYFTVHISYLKTKINKNQNISIWAPCSTAHINIFQFILKTYFNYNACTKNWVPLTGNCDSHELTFLISDCNHSLVGTELLPPYHCPMREGSGMEATEACGGVGTDGGRHRLQGVHIAPVDGDVLLIPWTDPYPWRKTTGRNSLEISRTCGVAGNVCRW